MSGSEIVGKLTGLRKFSLGLMKFTTVQQKRWKMYKEFAEITVVAAAVCSH